MRWQDTLRTAADAVRSHRLRSALTMLGILIGISAVVLTVGLGAGARADIAEQIDELGSNVLVVSPGSSTDSSGQRGGFGTASTLTVEDAAALASDAAAPDVAAVAGVATTSGSLTAGSTNWTTTLTGTTPSWQDVRARKVTEGRFLNDEDEADAAAVAVLGPDTASELFGSAEAAVGNTVTFEGSTLEVVGVLEELSSSEDTTNNDLAIVPMSTYAQRLVGGTDRDAVSEIVLTATDAATLSAAYQEAVTVLLNRHGITDTEDADFSIATQESILTAASSVDDTMTVMLGGIAVISLLVGGIGVMNIMLVSVSERVREIGLRKAIGGRPRAIRRQFLVEASILGAAGGVLGVLVGLAGAAILPRLTEARVELSAPVAAMAIVIAMAIGVAFGVYPAGRAARLAPIDALRND
jgi:putative ABC transport system permease protein